MKSKILNLIDIAKQVVSMNPGEKLILSGGIALVLRDKLIRRVPVDIDFVCYTNLNANNFKVNLPDGFILDCPCTGSDGKSVTFSNQDGTIKIDILLKEVGEVYDIIDELPIATIDNIIAAKVFYIINDDNLESAQKHFEDIRYFVQFNRFQSMELKVNIKFVDKYPLGFPFNSL